LGVLDHFGVPCTTVSGSRILGSHPAHQRVFELFGIYLLEQSSERPLRGHVILSRLARAGPATQAAALGMVEATGKFGNGVGPLQPAATAKATRVKKRRLAHSGGLRGSVGRGKDSQSEPNERWLPDRPAARDPCGSTKRAATPGPGLFPGPARPRPYPQLLRMLGVGIKVLQRRSTPGSGPTLPAGRLVTRCPESVADQRRFHPCTG